MPRCRVRRRAIRGSTAHLEITDLLTTNRVIFSPPTNHAFSEVLRLLARNRLAGASRFPEIAAKRTRRRARRGWRFR